MTEESNYTLLETHIEKIPGFEITPDLQEKQACTKIYTIAGLKTMNMKKEVASVLKKLLDDRRRLTKMCLNMFCLSHLSHQSNNSVFKNECIVILQEATGKTIDELIEKPEVKGE